MGDLDRALAAYRAALPLLRGTKDLGSQASLLNNRGILLCDQGSPRALRAATADLSRAEALFADVGDVRGRAMVLQNLGFVAAKRGEVTEALAWFETADEQFRLLGVVDPVGMRDRCEALLPARLLTEARTAAERAVSLLREQGELAYLAEAQLVLARTTLLQGEFATAQIHAHDAATLFTRQRRPRWNEVARQVEIEAAWRGGERTTKLLRAARGLASSLEANGWDAPARHMRVIAAQIALAKGRPELIGQDLDVSARAYRHWPAEFRVQAYHAVALQRFASGDRAGGRRLLQTGLRMLDRYRVGLGASELRAHAAGLGTDLATTGLRQAMADGRPESVLWWSDRWRAACLHTTPRPSDSVTSDLLIELRHLAKEVDRAFLAGLDPRAPARRLASLEEEVCRRARQEGGSALGAIPSPPTLARLRSFLGERAFIELFELDRNLYAVAVTPGEASIHSLGDAGAAEDASHWLLAGLRRLANVQNDPRRRRASLHWVAAQAIELDQRIIAPLAPIIQSRDLVLAPPPSLFSTAWAALPSLQGRAVTVVPSASLWVKGASEPLPAGDNVLLVGGPDLPHAPTEIADVVRCYPNATVLAGESAIVPRVCRELERASLGHLAVHGRFRSDNPLLSSLLLADGPLTVYDLEDLSRAPDRLVLSACSGGATSAVYGSELMGFLTCLFSLGTKTVVAPVAVVEDEASARLMVSFHTHLQAGCSPAHAMSAAAHDDASPGSAARMAFVCFGVG